MLRISTDVAKSENGNNASQYRNPKGKAIQFTTVNAKFVVIKDIYVYTNKG